jgi:hypothetical protein
MLEQIVDEIHAPDRAMEEVAGEYCNSLVTADDA